MKIWAKLITDGKIKQQFVYENPERLTYSHFFDYLTDICTVPVNIAGLPAVSVPCGQDQKGLPIGMQLSGWADIVLKAGRVVVEKGQVK